MKEIGETAWIPFFTAGIGNLAGGFLCSWLLRSDFRRKLLGGSALFFSQG